MTDNFDPECWCAIARDALGAAFHAGRPGRVVYEKVTERLQEKP